MTLGRLDDPGSWPLRSSICRGRLTHSPTASCVFLTGVGQEPAHMRAGDAPGAPRPTVGTGKRENEGQLDLTSRTTATESLETHRDRRLRVVPPWLARPAPGHQTRLSASRSTAAARERGMWKRVEARSDRRLLCPDGLRPCPSAAVGSGPAQPPGETAGHECDPTPNGQASRICRQIEEEGRHAGQVRNRSTHTVLWQELAPLLKQTPTAPGIVTRRAETQRGSVSEASRACSRAAGGAIACYDTA